MSEKYPGLELERFNKANLWIKYIIFKIMRFLRDDMLEVGAGLGSFTRGYMKNFHSIYFGIYSLSGFGSLFIVFRIYSLYFF